MEINYIDPPNRAMNTEFKPSIKPILYKDLMFIDFDENDRLLVGSTNVTSSFWEGSLQIFHDYKHYQEGKHQSYYNSSILFDGKFLKNSNKQLISESESKLKILTLPTEGQSQFDAKPYWVDCVECYEAIKQIRLWDDEHAALTASNNHLTQWDMGTTNLRSVWNFTDYHTDTIMDIDTRKNDSNIFVSVGRDKRACLWDIRMDSVAQEIYNNEFCSLTSVAWTWSNGNIIVVGSQGGNLYMIDVKQPNGFLNVQHCYKKSIFKLQFCNISNNLAVIGDTNEVQVYNCKGCEFQSSYKNTEKHSKFVRDAKWHNGNLYTCGFESSITKHSF